MIVPIFKKKDNTDCDNYRGISLLCHSEKIFASVVLQRIKTRTRTFFLKHRLVSEVVAAPSTSCTHYAASRRCISSMGRTFSHATSTSERRLTACGENGFGKSLNITDIRKRS